MQADLDTLCTSLLLAYLRTYTNASSTTTFYIPISNLPRADIPLRQELLPVLARANIKTTDLITLNDLPPVNDTSKRIPPDQTRWILVDHNALQGDLGKVYGSRLAGCIDHHDEENKVPKATGDEPRVIQPCGSCGSLVVDYCKDAWAKLSAESTDQQSRTWDSEVASVALAPILIDTGNLKNDKTTTTDVSSAEFVEKLIQAERGAKFNATEYWTELLEAKQSIDRLTIQEILRKDYKQWNEPDNILGISSMVKNLSFLLNKADSKEQFLQSIKTHAQERDLSMCCIMASFHDGKEYTREIFLWAFNEQGVKAAQHFEIASQVELGLEEWNGGSLDFEGEGEWRRAWWQRKTEHSRKRVAPLMRSAIEQAG